MHRFKVRPGYKTNDMLIEFVDDHRSSTFPNVESILKQNLKSRRKNKLKDIHQNIFNFDGVISTWTYTNGVYEIADDIWGLFVHADKNNKSIMNDIEAVLVSSGLFIKEEVDFNEYK